MTPPYRSNAVYIKLGAKGKVAKTIEHGGDINIDYNEHGRVLGVEILGADTVELDGVDLLQRKLWCPGPSCRFSFVGQGAERRLVDHYGIFHTEGLVRDKLIPAVVPPDRVVVGLADGYEIALGQVEAYQARVRELQEELRRRREK